MDYREMLRQPEYAFLQTDIHLGQRILLLGMAGSISYGTNHEGREFLKHRHLFLSRQA